MAQYHLGARLHGHAGDVSRRTHSPFLSPVFFLANNVSATAIGDVLGDPYGVRTLVPIGAFAGRVVCIVKFVIRIENVARLPLFCSN
jgi:hypothetical protein